MKQMVTAVVVTHDAGDYLEETLRALKAQSRPVDRIVVVDTGNSPAQEVECDQLIRLSSKSSLSDSLRVATEQLQLNENHWIWILHEDSAPEVDCLEQLLLVEEKSALVGIIGPKQMRWDDARYISQLGLTLTPWGTPLSLVTGELDQSQHDDSDDVLAVGTAGALIRADIWHKLGGLSPKATPLAADYDLSLRARLEGYRVVVAPKAKVRHASLSLSGKRSKRWLGGSPKTALRKAAIHIRFSYSPLWLALLFWFALPIVTIGRVFWRLLQKRPDRLVPELLAGVWGYFTVFARLSARSKYPQSAIAGIRKSFDAPWSRVRSSNRARLDAEEAAELKSVFDRGEHELETVATGKGFVASGGFGWMALLVAFSYSFVPTGEAPFGNLIKPMASNWFEVFLRTGVSWQPLGFGFYGPSEPFNWVLLGLASLTPWTPSLAMVWLLFLAPAIAFAGAWRVASLVTSRAWARAFAGLTFALWPAVIQQRSDAQLASLVATLAMPWLAFAVARAAGLGRSGSARSMRQTWSWVGLSGLLLGVVGVSSPVLILPILFALALAAFTRIRRFGYLFWIPLPLAALFTPLAIYLIGRGEFSALLADPSITRVSQPGSLVQMWLPTNSDQILNFSYLTAFAFALLALLTRRWVLAGVIWLFLGATLALFDIHANSSFIDPFNSDANASGQFVNGSTQSLGAAIGLLLATLIALTIEHSKLWARRVLSVALLGVLVVPLGVAAATAARNYDLKDDRVIPWLLQANAESNQVLNVLRLGTANQVIDARIIPATGTHLEDANVAYRYSISELQSDPRSTQLAKLVADLRSGRSDEIESQLSQNKINYVLLVDDKTDESIQLANQLDSFAKLEPAGATEFGTLWRVVGAKPQLPDEGSSIWSLTKGIQLSVLVGFLLLAIPTTPAKRRAQEVPTFIEGEGDSQ